MGSAAASATDNDAVPDIDLAKYLWVEFSYRHDLVWRLLFRVTAVATLLSVAPFTIDDSVREAAGVWVKALAALALALVAGSWPLLLHEFRLFRRIDGFYAEAQERVLQRAAQHTKKVDSEEKVPQKAAEDGKQVDVFALVVFVWPVLLLVLAGFAADIVWHTP